MDEPFRLICTSGRLRRLLLAKAADQWAATFKVSVACVMKWPPRFRATGSAAARRMGGNRPYVLSSERDRLLKRLANNRASCARCLQSWWSAG